MVSFSCENCGDILTKKRLDPHRNQCRGAYFTCIDCMTTFNGFEYRSHTSCMSEEQKYQGALYKNKNKNKNKKQKLNDFKDIVTPSRSTPSSRSDNMTAVMSNYQTPIPPRVPSPPLPRETSDKPYVFDYYVGESTPAASTIGRSNELVRFEGSEDDTQTMIAKPTPAAYETPVPRSSNHHNAEFTGKPDKKRKRLHVDTTRHSERPSMHTGLTGNLVKMMPPSPAESGSPSSPIKKSKHKDSNSIFGIFGSSRPKKESKSKSKSSSKDHKKSSSRSRSHHKNATKLLEAKPEKKEPASEGQVILFDANKGNAFLSLVPETAQGYSLHKVLRRHCKKTHADKAEESAELLKLLRVRRNAQGEIVLFVPESDDDSE